VQEGYRRLTRIEGLIAKRNEMRSAVEACDFKRMKSLMKTSDRLVRMYGADLFEEEMHAMKRMNDMHERELVIGQHTHHEDAMGEGSQYERVLYGKAWGADSAHLPLFIYSLLGRVHRYRDVDDAAFKTACERLVVVAPDVDRRNHYTRLFKWVVAFATWKYRDHTLN
jgi:hypothetical protein